MNLPSPRLWSLVEQTLSAPPARQVRQIVLTPATPVVPVRLSSIVGASFTVTGQVVLLNLQVTTIVTVTVDGGEPDLAFDLSPPQGWTLGQSLLPFANRRFDLWCSQLEQVRLRWQSAARTAATALVLDASLDYSGAFALVNSLYPGQNSRSFSQPIAFGEHGPTLDARIPIVPSGTGALAIGPVQVSSPSFAARLFYLPSDEDESQMEATTSIGLAWQLESHNAAVRNFEVSAWIAGDYPVLIISGGYPRDEDTLALADIVSALYGSQIAPPDPPGPLQFLTRDVGLQSFSVTARVGIPPVFRSGEIYFATKASSPGWVIIGPDADPLLALQEIHFGYSAVALPGGTVHSVLLGGTLKIGTLLFGAEATYSTLGPDYVIEASGELATADGLPLRLAALIEGLGAPRIAAAFNDFLELSFTSVGADLRYAKTGDTVAKQWSAHATADLKLKLFGQEFLGLHNTSIAVSGTKTGDGPTSYAVAASGDVFILGITLPAQLKLSGETKTFTVGPFSLTLGGIITWMVNIVHPSWNYELPEPWNALNSIGFEDAKLVFDMEKQTVTLDTGVKADLGFISLDSLRLTYHRSTPGAAKQGVILAMKGTFLGLPIEVTTDDPDLKDNELGWDLINGKPVEVPGAGDELFKLEYLGIGQHVGFRDTRELKTIGSVITALETNLKPVADSQGNPLVKLDGLVFAENSGWLLGTKFTLLSTVTISAIFNDPQLYGLRIELGGEKAGSLSGLQFEILYKRITDTIGLYHIDLRLPDSIRQLEFGEVSVTIPEFVLDIYTNGNFRIDVGFPYKLDFSRSFSVELFPFVGFGGFYFAYLEGATSDRVPRVTDGSFKPVLEFGLGLSLGVGKTIDKGMLSAGATLTVEGLVEGVLAWFNPDDTDRDTALFYAIAGTVAIEGHLYGSIDFKIVKASIDITASARVTLQIECYKPIHIELNVSVSARVSVKILFVTIHCSFNMDLSLEYTIGHDSTTPWTLDSGGARQQIGLAQRRHVPGPGEFARMRILRARRIARAPRAPMLDLSFVDSAALLASTEDPVPAIALQFRPFFTQSDQPSLANAPAVPLARARSVPMLFTASAGGGPDSNFAMLAGLAFKRVAAARLAQKTSERDRLSLFDLSVIKHQLDLGLHDPDFAYDALVTFFRSAGIVFEIDDSAQTAAVSGTFFPMIPALTLKDTLTDGAGAVQHFVDIDYRTDARFMVDQSYESLVDLYFQAFQVSSGTSVEREAADGGPDAPPAPATGSESMAQYVFRDYFLMITQSMVDSAIAYLDSYPHIVAGTAAQSLNSIAAAMAAPNDPDDENPTALSIASANVTSSAILDPAAIAAADIAGAFYQANSGESLDHIAARFGVTALDLAEMVNPDFKIENAAVANMINPGIRIDLGDIVYTVPDYSMDLGLISLLFSVTPDSVRNDRGNAGLDFGLPLPAGTLVCVPAAHYVLQPAETLAGVALAFKTNPAALVTRNSALTTLVRALSIWAIPTFRHVPAAGDTLQSIARQYALPLARLLAGGYAAAPIVKSRATVTIPYRPDIPATDLYTAMSAGAVTDPIAKSVSRFMMHGLRLPRISPVTFDSMKPFYDNIGQQIDVPDPLLQSSGSSYSLQLSASPRPDWISFKGGSTAATYIYTAADIAEIRIFDAVYLPASVTVRQMPLIAYAPNRYPLRQVVHWQSPHGLKPVTGQPSGDNGEPNIWLFPSSLCERLIGGPAPNSGGGEGTGDSTSLKFAIAVGHQETPNAPPVFTPVASFAWATLVEIGVKRVVAGSAGAEKVGNDYLVSGADPANRDTLYRLWTHMAQPSYADSAEIHVLSRADPAGQSAAGVISQDLVAAGTAVIKTNLSTTTHPVSQRLAAKADTPSTGFAAAIDDPVNFLRLLWECATVNSGGFYLNYTEAGTGAGLPDALFDAGGGASIQLLVIFASQRHSGGTLAGQPPTLRISNCALLADQLDLANAELTVEAASFTVEQGKSLADVQAAMGFAALADFVAVNQDIKVLLRQGLAIGEGSGTTVRSGDSLATIAARTGSAPLAVANEVATDAGALIPGALCQYARSQLKLIGTGAVGTAGLEVIRPNPDPDDAPYSTLSNQQKLELSFNLLGVDLVANSWFQPLAMTTGAGQPAGHAKEWPAAGPLEPDDTLAQSRAGSWVYRKVLPYYEFAVPGANAALAAPRLPPPDRNPYAGIAPSSAIAVDIHFQDNFGNRTDGGHVSGSLAISVGYRDLIQPLSAWPGVAASYLVGKVDPQPVEGPFKIGIEIDVGFRVANYVSGAGQSVAQARKRIAADQEKMRQIYYQIIQPDLQASLATSLDSLAGDTAAYGLPKSRFTDIVNATLLFFGQQLELTQVQSPGIAGDTLAALSARWLITDPGAFLKANMKTALGAFFDLAAPRGELTVPVTILARAGQSLANLAASATAAMGAPVTEVQLATRNATVALRTGTAVAAPERPVPGSGDPPVGDRSLAGLAEAYRTTVSALAQGNRSGTGILRTGTGLTLEGVDYVVQAGDSFDSVARAFMQIPVATGRTTFQQLADARGLSIGALAFANETDPMILAQGASFTYPDPSGAAISVAVNAGDSLYAVAGKVAALLPAAGVTVESLVAANKDVGGLIKPTAVLATGLNRVTVDAVANANSNASGLFAPAAQLTTAIYRLQPGDTMSSVVAAFAPLDPNYSRADFVAANAKTADLLAAGTRLLADTRSTAPDPSQTLSEFAGGEGLSFTEIGFFNGARPLASDGKFLVPDRTAATGLSFAAVQPAAGQTLAQVASLFGGTTAGQLVEGNANMWRTLEPGKSVQLNGTALVTRASDTFARLWTASGGGSSPDYAALAAAVNAAGALRDGAVLVGPKATAGASDVAPADLAARWNVDVDDLLNSNRAADAFLKSGATVRFPTKAGAVPITVRANDTINTFFDLAAATDGLQGLDRTAYFAALAAAPGLIAAGAPFVVPPTIERIATRINRGFPAKLFPLSVSVQLSRINFKVTAATRASLEAVPDIGAAPAAKLAAMATAAKLYIDGDEFDAALRVAFGAEPALDYLIAMTRRYSALPTVLMDPLFEDVAAAQTAETSIPAHAAAEPEGGAQSLRPFATAFEAAFGGEVKTCVSAGGDSARPGQPGRKLWAVDFSSGGYGFAVAGGNPSFFARRPISNRLLGQNHVPMRHYVSGSPVPAVGAPVDIKQVDLDVWAKQFLETVDLALSPQCAVAIRQHAPDALTSLLTVKGALAGKVAAMLGPLIDNGHAGDLALAGRSFADRLKIRLADAYKIDTVLQFPVGVTNGGSERPGMEPPRLFGQPVNRPYVTAAAETLSTLASAFQVSQSHVAAIFGDMPGILDVGPDGGNPVTITYVPTGTTARPTPADSLATLAAKLGISSDSPAQALIGNLAIAPAGRGLFAPGVSLNAIRVAYSPPSATTIEAVALILDVSVLLLASAMQDSTGLFNPAIPTLTWRAAARDVTVPLTSASTLNSLASAFASAGVSPAPDAADVANYFRVEPSGLIAPGATLSIVQLLPTYSFDATAAPLSVSESALTLFLEVANPARARKLFMDLDFQINQIEHKINGVAADPRYENSAWLSFLLPFDSAGGRTDSRIGLVEIPIANQSYPDIPIVTGQGGTGTALPPPPVTVPELKRWDYYFEFEYRAAAQDLLYVGVTINEVAGPSNRRTLLVADEAGLPTNVLEALAQFNASYQSLTDDLQKLPFLSAANVDNPVMASSSVLAEFASRIEQLWGVLPSQTDAATAAADAHRYKLITTRAREQEDFLDTLIVGSLTSDEGLWPARVRVAATDGEWHDLEPLTPSPTTETVFAYPAHRIRAGETLRHRLYFDGLDAIVSQSAKADVQVKRNEALSSQGPTRPEFVYQTPAIATFDDFTPLIVRADPFVMPPLPAPNGDLAHALSDFFRQLFDIGTIAWPTGASRPINLHVGYRFDLAPGQPLAGSMLTPQAPSVLHTEYAFSLHPASGPPDYEAAAGTFVTNVADVVRRWIAANLDPGQTGRLVFDLVVFEARTTTAPNPILKLSTLLWNLP